jgi:ATP-dependent Lon protease
MKWTFGGEMGSMSDLGAIGSEGYFENFLYTKVTLFHPYFSFILGEYYFHAQKKPRLKGPTDILGKQKVIAIFPYNNVLLPGSLDRLNVFEMKYRQLLTDAGDNSFGISYYSQPLQKLGLVGTLAKIKSQKMFDDGRVYALIECTQRYYVEEIISDRPYIKARVRTFHDYTESMGLLNQLEQSLYNDIHINFKYLKMLYPDQDYSLNAGITKYQPITPNVDMRTINLSDEQSEILRSSKFSFAVLDTLKIEPPLKLLMLQVNRVHNHNYDLSIICL